MASSAMRDYLELMSGLTEVTRQRAVAVAKGVTSSTGAELVVPGAMGQVGALADEIMATAKANRELLTGMVKAEVDRAVGRLGLASRDDLTALQRQVDRLAARLAAPTSTGAGDAAEPGTTARKVPARKPAGTQAAGTKAAAKKAGAKKTGAKKPATKKAATKKAAVKQAPVVAASPTPPVATAPAGDLPTAAQ